VKDQRAAEDVPGDGFGVSGVKGTGKCHAMTLHYLITASRQKEVDWLTGFIATSCARNRACAPLRVADWIMLVRLL
jgi:hypothetical protein